MYESGKNGEEVQRFNELKINQEKTKLKKSSKTYQALNLPSLCNINPRSVYNKLDEFHSFVEEEELDCIFMSESWERDYLPLDKVIKLDDHVVISNTSHIANRSLKFKTLQTL